MINFWKPKTDCKGRKSTREKPGVIIVVIVLKNKHVNSSFWGAELFFWLHLMRRLQRLVHPNFACPKTRRRSPGLAPCGSRVYGLDLPRHITPSRHGPVLGCGNTDFCIQKLIFQIFPLTYSSHLSCDGIKCIDPTMTILYMLGRFYFWYRAIFNWFIRKRSCL